MEVQQLNLSVKNTIISPDGKEVSVSEKKDKT